MRNGCNGICNDECHVLTWLLFSRESWVPTLIGSRVGTDNWIRGAQLEIFGSENTASAPT
jgi:hypothetical protein